MSKLKQNKIPVVLTEDNILKIAVEQGAIENEFNWKLRREGDGKTCKSKEVLWLEWNENGTFKEKHDKPAIGRSLICRLSMISLLGKLLTLKKFSKKEMVISDLQPGTVFTY